MEKYPQVNFNSCDFCGICVAVCPENCITLFPGDRLICFEGCTWCGLCQRVCPSGAVCLKLEIGAMH